ncbi:hypothetical protein MMC14_003219 [Varicellaria rhodocarpa]|nr:hypothetical protein [Varicellaria rhodocarpa]
MAKLDVDPDSDDEVEKVAVKYLPGPPLLGSDDPFPFVGREGEVPQIPPSSQFTLPEIPILDLSPTYPELQHLDPVLWIMIGALRHGQTNKSTGKIPKNRFCNAETVVPTAARMLYFNNRRVSTETGSLEHSTIEGV